MGKYLLVLCLSVALILAQTGNFHMHLIHDDHAGSSAHVVDIHPISTRHNIDSTNHHGGHSADHSNNAVEVNPEPLLKNANLLSLLIIIVFFIGLFLRVPRQNRVSRQKFDKTLFPPCYYLFQPPLRAPPTI